MKVDINTFWKMKEAEYVEDFTYVWIKELDGNICTVLEVTIYDDGDSYEIMEDYYPVDEIIELFEKIDKKEFISVLFNALKWVEKQYNEL